MRIVSCAIAVVIVHLSSPSAALAEGQVLLLEDLTRAAVQANDLLPANHERAQARLARGRAASRLPNPEAVLEVENFGFSSGWGPEVEFTVGAVQAVPLGNRLWAVEQEAAAAAGVDRLRAQSLELAVRAEVETAFYQVLRTEADIQVVVFNRTTADRMSEIVGKRVAAGSLPAMEMRRMAALTATLSNEEETAREANYRALTDLSSLCGLPMPIVIQGSLHPGGRPEDPNTLVAMWDNSLAGQASELAMANRRARETTVESLASPDAEVGVGVRALSGFEGATLVFSFSVPIPSWNTGADDLDAAKASTRAQALENSNDRRRWEASLRSAWTVQNSAYQRWTRLTQQVIPASQALLDDSLNALAEGRAGTLDVLEASENLVAGRRQANEAALEFHTARVAIALLVASPAGMKGTDHVNN